MEVIHRICAGMDVHKDSVVVCVRKMTGNKVERELQTFGTMTSDLLRLGDWLEERGCKDAVIEATGVYSMKAVVAVAAAMLTAIYGMLRDRTPYRDLGPHHFADEEKKALTNHLLRRLRGLGVDVEVRAAA